MSRNKALVPAFLLLSFWLVPASFAQERGPGSREPEELRIENCKMKICNSQFAICDLQSSPRSANWSDLSLGNVIKDDFNAPAYQYPLIGNGGLALLADPCGLTQLKPSRAPFCANIYFSYWWKSSRTKRATPFCLKGGYGQDTAPDPGSLRSFRQTLDVVNGVLTSKVNLILSGSPVASTRTQFVTTDGVLVMDIVDSAPGIFRLQVAGEQVRYSVGHPARNATSIAGCRVDRGLLASTASLGDKHGACLAIVAEGGGTVDAKDGSVALPVGPGRPARFFIAAGSEIQGADYLADALAKAVTAARSGFIAARQQNAADFAAFWARSSVSLPDRELLTHYIRGLYILKALWQGNPLFTGCFGPRPEGYDGAIGTECDNIFAWSALVNANQAAIARVMPDWYERTLANAKQYAKTFLPQTRGAKWAWLAGYDGTVTAGFDAPNADRMAYVSAQAAATDLYQATYTNDDARLARAKELLENAVRFQLDACEKQGDQWVNNFAALQYGGVKKGTAIEQVTLLWALRACRDLGVGPAAWATEADKVYLPIRTDPAQGRPVLGKYQGDQAPFPGGDLYGMSWFQICTRVFEPGDPLLTATYHSLFASNVGIGNLKYTFFKGCLAAQAAQIGLGEEALTLLRWNLSSASLYDGLYFGEYDGAAEKTIEVGAHAMHVHAIQNMLLDGRDGRQIRVFPALPREWEMRGVGFNRMLADGGIEVSGQFDENGSRVTLLNTGKREQVRTILLRIPSTFLAVAEAAGTPIQGMVDGRFAKMKVRLPAGAETSLAIVPTRKGSWQSIDDADPAMAWSQGNWIIQKDNRCQAGTNHASETAGAHASLRFTGAAVRLIGQRGGNRGYVRIKIDDRDEGIFNLFAATPEYQVVAFERFGLPAGVHTLRVEASGLAGYGGGKYVDIDAIQVLKE